MIDGCDRCGRLGVPLLEASEQRSLCLDCITDLDGAGVDPEAVAMLRLLTAATQQPEPE